MNNFIDLTTDEIINMNGGLDWGIIAAGAGIVGLGIAIAATGGLAAVPVSVIIGAGTAGEIITAGAAVACGALGGAGMGYGLTH